MDRVTDAALRVVRDDWNKSTVVGTLLPLAVGAALHDHLTAVSERCIECGLCVYECLFLQRHGTPKAIADSYDPGLKACQGMAFQCSLCGLCTALCPTKVDPGGMFLEMRREAVRSGNGDYPQHRPVLDYEHRGTSKRYACYCLPAGCDTVFFPGCALSGMRPETVTRAYNLLRKSHPTLGMVLDCCANPSHDLGRYEHFDSLFGEMRDFLLRKGINAVLVACPNCHKVFKRYGRDLSVRTVYEVMAAKALTDQVPVAGTVTIHDPCAVRFEADVHAAVRNLVTSRGLTVREMPHRGESTVCCGEGGSVGLLSPALAGRWKSLRCREAEDTRIITYCAGCVNKLGPAASHVLDLVFEPEATVAGRIRPSMPPFTYWNRLRFKSRLLKSEDTVVMGARRFSGGELRRTTLTRFLRNLTTTR